MTMRIISKASLALCGGLALSAASALAQDSGALIDLLVKKGVVSDQEAEELRTELTKDFATNTSAGKLNLSSSLQELKLSGDVRLRHQEESKRTVGKTTNDNQTRERFRFRFNGDAILAKGWSAGFALETAPAADSGNQTFTQSNDDYNIYLARAYVGYAPTKSLSFVLGKQKNPLYTTDLVWDSDINPQGVSENYTYSFGGKDKLEFRGLQVIMQDNKESVAGRAGHDGWLFAQQLVFTKYIGSNSLVLAPGYMTYNSTDLGTAMLNETPFTGSPRSQAFGTLAGEFNIANVAGEGTSLKLYADSSYNFEAASRVSQVYGVDTTKFDKGPLAWLLGVGYNRGTGKMQGDYSLKVDYRRIGLGAVDPNLSDSDFGFGNLNMEGFKIGTSYNLTDFASFNLTYFNTKAIDTKLYKKDGKTLADVAKLDRSQILQADIVVKF